MAQTVMWSPQPGPQTIFSTRHEFEVLYGGSKGGGKSDVLLMEGMRQAHIPGYRAGFFRRTFPRLQEMIDRSHLYFPQAGGVWKANEHRWVFPSGARYEFHHIQNDDDRYNYNGQEFHYMAFDQLEEFSEEVYDFMIMQVRTSNPNIRCYVRASANPGNIGHAWVKRRWIENKNPMQTYYREFYLPDGRTLRLDSCFIPAKVYDNKILLEASPMYLAQLMSMPEHLRKAMLDGDWDVFAGQVFGEWRRDVHVVRPFKIPDSWPRFRSLDWGYAKPFAVHWFAVDEDDNAYCYREYYGCEQNALDVGLYLDAQEVGRNIAEIEKETKEKILYAVADTACWTESGQLGPSIIEAINNELIAARVSPFTVKSDKARIAGKMQMHQRLRNAADKAGEGLFFFENCQAAIRTIPLLVYDNKKVEDVDSSLEDHCYDSVRYFLMSRPIKAKKVVKPLPREQQRLSDHIKKITDKKSKKKSKRYSEK